MSPGVGKDEAWQMSGQVSRGSAGEYQADSAKDGIVCKTLVSCNNPSAHRGRRTTQIANGIAITIAMTNDANEIPKCCHSAVSKSPRRSINVCINVCMLTSSAHLYCLITS